LTGFSQSPLYLNVNGVCPHAILAADFIAYPILNPPQTENKKSAR
jgi:hypothetical protein